MFEHLGYIPETTLRKKSKSKVYVSFLMAALAVFTFSFSINRGPCLVAQEYVNPAAQIVADDVQRNLAVDNPRFPVFSFIIKTNLPGIELSNLKVKVNGVYDVNLLKDLKLYHQGVQLGTISEVGTGGSLYFDIDGYQLPAGDNLFSFILSTGQATKVGNILEFNFQDQSSVILSYQGHPFTPNGQWPIVGSLTSVVEHGSIAAYNNIYNTELLIVDSVPRLVGNFSLANKGEIADLYSLTVGYRELSDNKLDNEKFVLLYNEQTVAKGSLDVKENKIVFKFEKSFVISNASDSKFELHALSLPTGVFEFYLQDISALGFVSGKNLSLEDQLQLSYVDVVDYYPEFSLGELETKLSDGWNELYDLNIQARGSDDIKLHKLSWSLGSIGTSIEEVELWINNQQYMADLTISGEDLIVKTDWEDPLDVSRLGTNLKLLVKVSESQPGSKLSVYLLTDEIKLSEVLDSNILWSLGEQFYSGYKLPQLPLGPSVLSY